MPELVIADLSIEYASGGHVARPFDGFDLRVEPGSLVLLLGPSGCGKTTLLSTLAGILRPSRGSIRYGATEIASLTGRGLTAYRRHGVGVVFQAFNLVPSLNAVENVMVPMLSAGVRRRRARARAVRLLTDMGLGDRLHHHPGALSGGQQQRVAIARALGLDPPLLLADEPTAHLDHIQVEGVLRVIRGLTDGGRVVVVATHDERIVALADEVVELAPRVAAAVLGQEERTLTAGEILFAQDTRGDRIYVVEDGEIELVRIEPGGDEILLATRAHGEHFGEMDRCSTCPDQPPRVLAPRRVLSATALGDFRERFGITTIDSLIREQGSAPQSS